MVKWAEVLKASKGLHARDSFSEIWGLKLKAAKEQWPITTLTGSLPLTYESRIEHVLKNYALYGSASGAGVETENLFDKNAKDTNNGYLVNAALLDTGAIADDAKWDVTEYISVDSSTQYVFSNMVGVAAAICWYDSNKNYISGVKVNNLYGGYANKTLTSPATAAYTRFSLLKVASGSGTLYFEPNVDVAMLTLGSTAPSTYIPHGYKILLTNTGENSLSSTYPLYIGSSKIGAEEFIDYASQKIYSLKEVHTDTVTINGIEWDILGYDHDTVYKADGTRAQHTVTIQTRNAQPTMQFDAPEAWYYAENGLAAGAYYFTIDPTYDATYNTYKDSGYQFTLTQDIPAGGVLTLLWGVNAQASGMTLSSYATAGATTAIESNITVSEGTTGTNLGELTSAGDPTNNRNSIAKARFGSNNYKESAIRQYLNSDKAAGSVWTPQTKFDRPPSWVASSNGFLYGVDSDFLSVLGNAQKVTSKNTVTDGGGTEATSEKVFLLSTTEAYGGGSEGAAYDYYKNYSDLSGAGTGADANRIKYRNNTAQIWWIRSPDQSFATVPRVIASTGMVYNNYANSRNSYGVVPACCIVLDDLSTNSYLQTIFAKSITDPPAPLPAITAYAGENTISSTETVGEVSITGEIKSN